MVHISDIKLIRTDTTLDLSQKAEKGMILTVQMLSFYILTFNLLSKPLPMWDFHLIDMLHSAQRQHYILSM